MKQFFFLASLIIATMSWTSCGNDSSADTSAESVETANAVPSAEGMATTTAAGDAQMVQPEIPAGPTTKMTFKYLEYDFGTVKDGEVVRHDYQFTNTGTEPLIIADAKASCGCTVPQWPKEPIQPGGSGKIRVEFDSKGKPGPQSKRVTITANTDPSPVYLTIKGNVEGKTN
jgi:hypothetical protein